jgi:hypothetical protein
MNLLASEEATNFKARRIALASALKIEVADGNLLSESSCRRYSITILGDPSV